MGDKGLDNYPDTPLKQEMLRAGLSIRALAKVLAGSDDARLVDQERTAVKRWLNPAKGISRASSERLAAVFGQPAAAFYRETPRARQVRLAELEEQGERQAALIAELTRRLTSVESRLAAAPPRRGTRRRAQGES